MTYDPWANWLASANRVVRRGPNEFRAEILVDSDMNGDRLQSAFNKLMEHNRSLLTFTVHGVRDFASYRSSSTSTPISGLIPCETWDHSLQFYFPKADPDLLWTPSAAPDLQSSGVYSPRYFLSRPLDLATGTLDTAPSDNDYMTSVFTFEDMPIDDFLTSSPSTEVPGVFMVHEQFTDTYFPLVQGAVVRWQSVATPTYRLTQLDVCPLASIREDILMFGKFLDMNVPLDDVEADAYIRRYTSYLRLAMNAEVPVD